MVVVSGAWVGEHPNTKGTLIPSPMAQSLFPTGLSNIESGGPQAANNNIVGWKLSKSCK